MKMKRLQERDSPPPKPLKRSRGVVSSGGFDGGGPLDGPRSPSASSSGSKPPSSRRPHGKTVVRGGSGTPPDRLLVGLDYHPASSRRAATSSSYDKEYRILCVSGINHRVSDVSVRDGVFREFKKYGDIDVKLASDGPERFAYVYFRTSDEARDARHSKAKLILFDKPVLVEPIFETPMPVVERRSRRHSISPDLVGVPGYINKMSRAARGLSPAHSTSSSSGMQRRRSSIDRLHGPPPMHHLASLHHHHHGGHHHNHDSGISFRRDPSGGIASMPPIPHPDFLTPHGVPPVMRRTSIGVGDDLKKEKFPNYLHHIPPEEDDKANRTLFIGNLEVNIGEPELRRIFERYGVVEDVDIKRPPPGQGNAYAFVKFLNLDMAHKSKVEMSGQYIGKFQCKIGYGKPVPTTRIWVGGLGPWTSLSHLEKEFDRFGAIKKIDFVKGDNHAYILYDSIDAAQEACKDMRGFPLGGPKKRLRVDFADTGPYNFSQTASGASVTAATSSTAAAPRAPPPAAYPPDDDPYYRRRVEQDHPSLRGPSSDPYHYYGNSRDPDYTPRWPRGSSSSAAVAAGSFGPDYDPYYDRPPRSRIDDDWAAGAYAGERGERNHDFTNWGRDYPSWREGGSSSGPGNGRDWGAASDQPRRKPRPRTPDFDGGLAPRGDAAPYRRYARQRSPSDVAVDSAALVGRTRRRTPPSPSLQQRGYRPRGEPREHEMSPGWRSSQMGRSERRRVSSRSPDGGGAGDKGMADRSSSKAIKIEADAAENGRNPMSSSQPAPTSPGGSLLLPDGHAQRLVNASNLSEVARLLPCTWHGGLVLKSSYFPIRMYACEGNVKLVESLTKDGEAGAVLRITQRLRLDQPKLDDVSKRLSGGNYCILLGLASQGAADVTEQTRTLAGGQNVQQRPLRNLVAYLKQKEAAGVIALTGGKDAQGVLYAFPPCQFSQERLHSVAPRLGDEGLKDDHLIVAVVKGGI